MMLFRNVFRAVPALLSLFLMAPIAVQADKPAAESAKSKPQWSCGLEQPSDLCHGPRRRTER